MTIIVQGFLDGLIVTQGYASGSAPVGNTRGIRIVIPGNFNRENIVGHPDFDAQTSLTPTGGGTTSSIAPEPYGAK